MKIVIIGAGNIATQYAKKLYALGHNIIQIQNRTSANAKPLADVVSAKYIPNVIDIDKTADLYIIAVSDDHIKEIINDLPTLNNGIIIHTSGATDIEILNRYENYGVIYPPQSLNKALDIDLSKIPFAIEGSNIKTEKTLLTIAKSIAEKSFVCSSKQRLALHIAAVFANNFTNAMYNIAETILENNELSFDLIKPIILETAEKVQNHRPQTVQTGPALRHDKNTLKTHFEFLKKYHNQAEIYQIMSDYIKNSR